MGFSTTSQWYLYGKKYFTQNGYKSTSEKYPKPDIYDGLDLKGKVYMVTGANSGIGKEMAKFLASKNATVYMVCRSMERAEKARKDIIDETKNEDVHILQADCSLEADVRKLWATFSEKSQVLHGLVCNAGALLSELTLTKEGVETTFATHLLYGTYLLGSLAIPTLKATPGGRLVVVSSGGMYNYGFPEWDIITCRKGKYDGNEAYAYAKRGQVLLCEEWAKMHPDLKIVCTHPGWTQTEGVDAALADVKKYLQPLRTTWEGCEGICWLIVVDQEKLESGAFYLDREPCTKHLAGPFFTEGKETKNSPAEVQAMMDRLERWSLAETRPGTLDVMGEGSINSKPLMPLSTTVDLPKYQGRWYVWASIPTWFEKGTTDNVEDYEWDASKKKMNIFFRSCSNGKESCTVQTATMDNAANTKWKLKVKKLGLSIPVPIPYLVSWLADDCSRTIVGVPDRSYVWLMARTQEVNEKELQEMINLVDDMGYNIAKINRPEYTPGRVASSEGMKGQPSA